MPSDYNFAPLVERGISEFYFGYIPRSWMQNYSIINSMNRRYSPAAQCVRKEELKKIIKVNKRKNINFYLAVNAHLYTSSQIKKIFPTLREFQDAGLEGIIVADFGMIIAAKSNFPRLKIHASCGTVCLNTYTSKFLKDVGVSRIILDRSVSYPDLKSIRLENPSMEIEAFINATGCPNIDGLCTHHHSEDLNINACSVEENYFDKSYRHLPENPYFRLYYLYKIGVDYVKISRGDETADEILKAWEFEITLINDLLINKPRSFHEWLARLIVKYKYGKNCLITKY